MPGVPQPGGSKKGFPVPTKSGRTRIAIVEDAKKNAPWRANVALAAGHLFEAGPLTGPLRVTFRFVMPRPASHYGTGKKSAVLKPDAPEWHTTRPDTTKLIRAAEDALTGIAWVDDAQVVIQTALKPYANDRRPGCWVVIQQIEPPNPGLF